MVGVAVVVDAAAYDAIGVVGGGVGCALSSVVVLCCVRCALLCVVVGSCALVLCVLCVLSVGGCELVLLLVVCARRWCFAARCGLLVVACCALGCFCLLCVVRCCY